MKAHSGWVVSWFPVSLRTVSVAGLLRWLRGGRRNPRRVEPSSVEPPRSLGADPQAEIAVRDARLAPASHRQSVGVGDWCPGGGPLAVSLGPSEMVANPWDMLIRTSEVWSLFSVLVSPWVPACLLPADSLNTDPIWTASFAKGSLIASSHSGAAGTPGPIYPRRNTLQNSPTGSSGSGMMPCGSWALRSLLGWASYGPWVVAFNSRSTIWSVGALRFMSPSGRPFFVSEPMCRS